MVLSDQEEEKGLTTTQHFDTIFKRYGLSKKLKKKKEKEEEKTEIIH